jgi:hypothetical protein
VEKRISRHNGEAHHMGMKKKMSAVSVISIAAATVFFGPATLAHADTTRCGYEGSDRVCVTNYSGGGSSLQVCDNEADGNGVYGEFWSGDPIGAMVKVGDGNGSAAGCGTRTWSHIVHHFYVCEDDLGDDTCNRVNMY